jgi:PilZ domain
MERRKDPRIELDQEVTVTVLSEPERPPFRAVAVEVSGGGMRIVSSSPVPYQATVKIEAGDFLLLAEVIRVEVSDDGTILGLKLQHSLGSLGDLNRLNQALRWEDREREPADPITVAGR